MKEKTRSYLISLLQEKKALNRAMIEERQRWLDYHGRDVKHFNKIHDQTFDDYQKWANDVIKRHENRIVELDEMIGEITG